MGCPDWPKCFGSWVPPTSVQQLPANYKDVNAAFRERKNQKFARYLRAAGFSTTAEKIENDKSILAETDFNVTKAWIEYGNRLVGVVIGLFIIALCWRSISLRKQHPPIFFFSLVTLMAVLLQGWFGSIVVSTNLTSWTVTVHLFLALLIVAVLVYLLRLSEPDQGLYNTPLPMKFLLAACMATLLIQVFLGTQIRESIDRLAAIRMMRESWISQLGVAFLIHRSFSLVVLILNAILVMKLRKTTANNALSAALIVLILGTFLTGVGMAYWAVPVVLQPVHLATATGAFGMQLLLFFRMNARQRAAITN